MTRMTNLGLRLDSGNCKSEPGSQPTRECQGPIVWASIRVPDSPENRLV